jgi:hypothetical protein
MSGRSFARPAAKRLLANTNTNATNVCILLPRVLQEANPLGPELAFRHSPTASKIRNRLILYKTTTNTLRIIKMPRLNLVTHPVFVLCKATA